MEKTVERREKLRGDHVASDAARVLRRNGFEGWTRPAPSLYPHQWSWDSAFIALGLAHVDVPRAAGELEALFAGQWATGKVPHIVYDPAASPKGYFPDAERWGSAALCPNAPSEPATSGLCQPPMHAIAALRAWEVARSNGRYGDGPEIESARAFLRESYPRLLSWHRYLATVRDPEGSGLVTIYHPWESGMDNSPRFDAAMRRVEPGEMPPFSRRDLQHVDEPSQRPGDEEYERYLWLLELLKRARYDEGEIHEAHPFLVKDVLFSAILVAANEALLVISDVVDAPEKDKELLKGWIERGRRGLDGRWDGPLGLCLDYDLRAAEPVRTRTAAGFAPLIAGGLDRGRLEGLLQTLDSPAFCGHPDLVRPLPPSTSPGEPGFHPRAYWRGPVWPVMNWLLWWSLVRAGEQERADRMRRAALEQLADGGFAEYFDPFTGDPLGSHEQSWTAAVALDFRENPNGVSRYPRRSGMIASLEQKRAYRIGVSGSYGGMNLGDEAILESIVAELRRRLPVAEIVVLGMNPDDTLARHDVERALPVRELSSAEIAEEIGHLDLLVIGGGGLLYDGEARHYVREVKIARNSGVPVMAWAIGAGPLENGEDRRAVRKALNRADVALVRDRRDRRLLHDVGVAREISVTADPAFLMKPRPFTPQMLRAEGIEPDAGLVGLSVREPGPAAPDLVVEHYHALLADVADFFVERTGAVAVFVPMEPGNDLRHAHEVVSRMSVPQHARILRGDYDSGQVLGFMSHLEFAVGMRLHFLIFAALAGVPFVPLPYASKVEGLVGALEIPALPLRALGSGRLLAFVDRAWEERAELRRRINGNLPSLKERAGRSGDLAVGLAGAALGAVGS